MSTLPSSAVESPFSPTESWSIYDPVDEPIEKARELMNQTDPRVLIDHLQDQIQHSENGIVYAVFKGEKPEEYSDTEALVMFNPFANAATPNMLVRSEFIRQVARFADIRDGQGKLKPVIMLASPGITGSALKLSRSDRRQVRGGELGPAAKELLHAVSTLEIGHVSLLGYSQGADMTLAGARKAYSANLDVRAVSVGEPAGVEKRSLSKLALDFMSAPNLKPSIERADLDAQKESVGKGRYEGPRFIASIFTSPINNFDLIKGMGASSFESRVQEILNDTRAERLVVAYGSDSNLVKPSAIEPALDRLHNLDGKTILRSIKIGGGNHTWGDQVTLLAKVYLRALR